MALSFDDFFVATAVVATAVVSVVAGLAATVPVIVATADVKFIPVGEGVANRSDIRALSFWASSNVRASNDSGAMHVKQIARVSLLSSSS